MKKELKSLLFAVSVLAAAASCAKENVEPVTNEGVKVNFTADALATKTQFGAKEDSGYPTLWTANQKVKISYNYNAGKEADVTPSSDQTTASFSAEFEKDASATAHNFYAVSPSAALLGISSAKFNVQIPTTQTPLDASCDESAQIVAAKHEGTAFPTDIDLTFSHVTAYGNLSLTMPSAAGSVSSIALTASKNIAGRWYYNFSDGSMTENSSSATITLTTSKTSDVFFACAPADLSGGSLTVTVTAEGGTYTKAIDLTGKTLKFVSGQVSKFAVDFSESSPIVDEVYTLVKDASTLNVGDKVIIAAADKAYAVSTTQNNNNRGQASVTKSSDGSTITNPGSDVQLFTLGAGSENETYSLSPSDGNYIYAASSAKNYLKTTSTLDANASWTIVCSSDGVATIKANGANTHNWLRYNPDTPCFSCYSSGQGDVLIYTDGKGTGTLPVLPEITLEKSEVSFQYNDTEVHSVTATITGSEKVTCSVAAKADGTGDEVDWLVADYADGKVNYNAKSNETTSARAAYIVVSATNSYGTATATIKVTQLAAGADKKLVFDFSSAVTDWPTAASDSANSYTYSLGGVNYSFVLKNVYCGSNLSYLMLKSTGYLGLPVIDGYKLAKVVAKSSSSHSTKTNVAVTSNTTGTAVTGGTTQTWSKTGTEYTYSLTDTSAGTMYYLYVTNKNCQIVTLTLTYTK